MRFLFIYFSFVIIKVCKKSVNSYGQDYGYQELESHDYEYQQLSNQDYGHHYEYSQPEYSSPANPWEKSKYYYAAYITLTCPDGYRKVGSGCYKYFLGCNSKKTWADAKKTCCNLNGNLLKNKDNLEQLKQNIYPLLKQFACYWNPEFIWIGGSDCEKEGSWALKWDWTPHKRRKRSNPWYKPCTKKCYSRQKSCIKKCSPSPKPCIKKCTSKPCIKKCTPTPCIKKCTPKPCIKKCTPKPCIKKCYQNPKPCIKKCCNTSAYKPCTVPMSTPTPYKKKWKCCNTITNYPTWVPNLWNTDNKDCEGLDVKNWFQWTKLNCGKPANFICEASPIVWNDWK
ncbi:unnamed protein product [Gordionus sp. m RMFG-2023]